MRTGFHCDNRIIDSTAATETRQDCLVWCVEFVVAPINVCRQPMDFCNKCGSKTGPDWVFCRSCGNPLDSPEIEAVTVQPIASANTPKVELISRGWDIVDVEETEAESGSELPTDPLGSDEIVTPVDPDAVEISVDEVTVVARAKELAPADEGAGDVEGEPAIEVEPAVEGAGEVEPAVEGEPAIEPAMGVEPAVEPPSDRWDHLRPHGKIPGINDPSRLPAKISQIAVLITAFSALVSAVLYLLLNIQLERFAAGDTSEEAVRDVRAVAEAGLLVLAGLAILSLIMLAWWMIKAHARNRLRPGLAGLIAVPALLGGSALVGYFALREKSTVADALTANSLIIVGLGLLMLASLAAIRTISRVEIRDRW